MELRPSGDKKSFVGAHEVLRQYIPVTEKRKIAQRANNQKFSEYFICI